MPRYRVEFATENVYSAVVEINGPPTFAAVQKVLSEAGVTLERVGPVVVLSCEDEAEILAAKEAEDKEEDDDG